MIKIIIADDQQLFTDLLQHMLSGCGEIEVLACSQNGEDAVKLAKNLLPDVILMDLSMPGCDGLEAIKLIRNENIKTKILVLSASDDDSDVNEAINNDVDGYILKSIGKEELILAIKSVYSGMKVIDTNIKRQLNGNSKKNVVRKGDKTIVNIDGFQIELTRRDIEIIQLIVDGKTTSEIARDMFLAEGRIRNIITEITSKLMLKDRTQLAVFAIKNKLVN